MRLGTGTEAPINFQRYLFREQQHPALYGLYPENPIPPQQGNALDAAGLPQAGANAQFIGGVGIRPDNQGNGNQLPMGAADLALAAGFPPGIPQVMKHTSFTTLYHDGTKDPMQDRAAAIVARFDAMADPPQDADALLETAVGNPSILSTYLCCAALNGNARPRVYVLHVLSKYLPAMDGVVTPWDNRIFSFLGDVLGEQALTVAIPASAFNVASELRTN